MKIAIVGEYDPSFEPHALTDAALGHSARHLDVDLKYSWISTADISPNILDDFDGAWIAPGSPYRDMGRTLQVIQSARLGNIPCIGTCGGFQHMVIEFARNQLGIIDAEHAEYDPYASRLIVSRLQCSLAGREMQLSFAPDSLVARIYGRTSATERYYCNFGVNPSFARQISDGGFRIVGSDSEGEARVMELMGHPYFIGTLFVPQFRSTIESPHPLVTAFLRTASKAFRTTMIDIERASVQDATLFAQLEQLPDTKRHILPYSESEHVCNILDPSFVYLRIAHAGELVGFFILVLDPDGNSVEFRRVVVADKGKGIGQSAIAAMEQFCRDQLQRKRIWLDVFESNSRGRHVYEKLGYQWFGQSSHQGDKRLLYQKVL